MKASVWKHGVIVKQQNQDRTWKIHVQRERYDRELKADVPCAPILLLYAVDDPYYVLEFTSRTKVQRFIRQLQDYADEVWPT